MSGGERSVSMTPYLHTFGRFCDDGDLQMIDSSSIRVHQHAANVKEGSSRKRTPSLGTCLTPDAWGARAVD